MPQQFADFRKRGTPAQHLCGQRMAKLMGPRRRGLDAGALESMSNDRTNGTLAQESTDWSFSAQKQPPTGAVRPTVLQVLCNRLANICWERKYGSLITFSSDGHLTAIPINIVKLEKGYFT